MALIGSRGRETPSKGSGFAGRSDIANLHAKLQNITSVDATVKVSQSSRSIDLRVPGSLATVARIDNIADGGGYSATEVTWNGTAWIDKPSGRSWGNDYDADEEIYTARNLLPLIELNNGTVSAAYAVGTVDQGTKTITVFGDQEDTVGGYATLQWISSTGNDGVYSIVSAVYADPSTSIVVSEAIPDATADGSLYVFDAIRVRVFPVKYATGTRWFFDGTGASDIGALQALLEALALLGSITDPVAVLGIDALGEIGWAPTGLCT